MKSDKKLTAAKSKAPAKKPVGVYPEDQALRDQIDSVIGHLLSLVTVYESQLGTVKKSAPLAQPTIQAACALDELHSRLGATRGAFDMLALDRQQHPELFEPGLVAVVISQSMRSTPAWKDEATRLAQELAVATNAVWNPVAFKQEIDRKYPPKPTTPRVKLLKNG